MDGIFSMLKMVENFILVLVILLMHMIKKKISYLNMMNLNIMKILKIMFYEIKI